MQKINHTALLYLQRQDFEKAQKLLYFNKKKYPCHQTYNNLGYYLITEGMMCGNGKIKNALEHGSRYLFKAFEMKQTVTNICAIVKSIELKINKCKTSKKVFYKNAYDLLKKASELDNSVELQYNLLRFYYLYDPDDVQILEQAKLFATNYTSIESVSLYFEILRAKSLIIEGNKCIEMYGEYIDSVDLLMFYTKTEQYEKSYPLCEEILSEYSIDKYIASAILENCICTNHCDEAQKYAKKILIIQNDYEYEVSYMPKKIFEELHSSSSYRRQVICSYNSVPPYLDMCCYFGCTLHNKQWNE